MDRIEEIEAAVAGLTPDEYRRFADRFSIRERTRSEDQIENDNAAGKLEFLFYEAEADFSQQSINDQSQDEFHEFLEFKMVPEKIRHVLGPCLMCNHRTEYGDVGSLTMESLRSRFKPIVRQGNVNAVLRGLRTRKTVLTTLEALLCKFCQAELPTLKKADNPARETESRRRERLSARYNHEVEVYLE